MAMEILTGGVLFKGLCRSAPLSVNVRQSIHYGFALQRSFASSTLPEDEERRLNEARKWITTFTPEAIPKEFCDITFARSSGPGK